MRLRLAGFFGASASMLAACTSLALAEEPAKIDAPRLSANVSWLGNAYPGAQRWVQQDIHAICVTPNGSVYTNVPWDEGGGQSCVYRDGQQVAIAGHTHGWGQEGGEAVAVNEKYVFIAQTMSNEGGGLKDPGTWPPKGKQWFGVTRRLRSDVTKPAAFPGGKGGKGDTLKECFLPVVEADEKSQAGLTGLVADAERLYASNPFEHRIDVLDAETMKKLASWSLDRPGPLALAPSGDLWVIQTGDAEHGPRVVGFSRDGKRLPQGIMFAKGDVPTSLAIDAKGRMFVADAGPDQQIHCFDHLDDQPFGEQGGIYSGTPGEVGPRKFNNPTGVGVDAAGNIYVASDGQSGGGGTVLESYKPNGSLNWRLLGLEFVDMADVDPGADAEIYTKEEHFHADYSRPRGAETEYRGFTVNRVKYPEDPRLHIWSAGAWVRRIQGKPFLFVTEMNAGPLQVYRFDPAHDGEIAIPSGLFAQRRLKDDKDATWPPHQPEKGEWLWRDANGDGRFDAGEYQRIGDDDAPTAQGWWVDDAGNVWQATEKAGVRLFPLREIDAHGNPVWDYASLKTFPMPPQLERVKRLRYDAAHDVMYLGGTTTEHVNQHWKPMGPVIVRYDGWSKGNAKPTWQIVAPYAKGSQGHESCEPMGFDVAGDYLFAPYTGASKALGFKTGHIEAFRLDDGRRVGYFEPSEDVGEIGLQDIRECLRAHRRADGEYLLFLEEDYKAKILMYRWKP